MYAVREDRKPTNRPRSGNTRRTGNTRQADAIPVLGQDRKPLRRRSTSGTRSPGDRSNIHRVLSPESLIASIVDRLRKTPDEETWVKVYTNARDDLGFPWTLHAVFAADHVRPARRSPWTEPARARDKPARFGMDKPGFGKQGYYTKQE